MSVVYGAASWTQINAYGQCSIQIYKDPLQNKFKT